LTEDSEKIAGRLVAKYAERTAVSPEQRRGEIERTLARYGCTAFGYVTDGSRAQIVFEMNGRRMRIDVRLPDRGDRKFTHLESRAWEKRSEAEAGKRYQQAVRQRWAALGLYLKAVCEAIDSGIVTAETAFLSYVVLPDGQTLGEKLAPQLEAAYADGQMPALVAGQHPGSGGDG
jgi:hypothetical protein